MIEVKKVLLKEKEIGIEIAINGENYLIYKDQTNGLEGIRFGSFIPGFNQKFNYETILNMKTV